MYEKGKNIEQYTIKYNNQITNEQAMVKVRFSPNFLAEIV
jgi:hypothetical protein